MSRFFDLVSKPGRGPHNLPANSRKPATDDRPRIISLDSNENPYGPSPRAIQAIQSVIASASSYPDDDSGELRRRLAAHHEMPVEQVLVTAGSTALLGLLCQCLLAPGLNAVTSERSFIVYSMAVRAFGAQLIETPMRDDGIDLDAILHVINEDTRIVFIANPNNPTGTILDAAAIDKFLAEVPGHVVVVLDEAYYDFAAYFANRRKIAYSRSIDYLRKGVVVVILRTFSKAHGLAGLRIGYGLGPADLMAHCARIRNTFSTSTVAQAAALAALDDAKHIEHAVSNNATQAQIVGVALTEMGYRVVPTSANFLYCDLGEDAEGIAGKLRAERVSVRALRPWGAPTAIRVSLGTGEQNQAFLRAMHKVVQSTRVP
jgi:histidinol-phosphate aminotransferase